MEAKLQTQKNGLLSLADFDFSVEITRRVGGVVATASIWDAIVSFKNRGRTRKTANYSINLTNFAHNNPQIKADMLAIGTNRFKRGGKLIFVFNNQQLETISAKIKGVSAEWPNPVVFSKAHVQKIFDECGIATPDKDDTAAQIYIKLLPIQGQPNVFIVQPKFVEFEDAAGNKTKKDLDPERLSAANF